MTIKPTPKQALDHALGNLAMAYGLSRAQLDAAKQYASPSGVEYDAQILLLEDHVARGGGLDDVLGLAAAMVLQAAGYKPKKREPKQREPERNWHTLLGTLP